LQSKTGTTGNGEVMAITFPRVFPSGIEIAKSALGLAFLNTVFFSDMARAISTGRVNDGLGDRWEGEWETTPLTFDQRAELLAWMISLEGGLKLFKAQDLDRLLPSTKNGSFPGNGLVMGASQTGTLLNVDGFPINSTILNPGDYFGWGNFTHMVTVQADTNGAGEVTLEFEPPLKSSPADNAAILTEGFFFLARLIDVPFAVSDNVKGLPVRLRFVEDL